MKASATISNLASVLDAELYTGAHLDAAIANSRLGFSPHATGCAGMLDWIRGVIAEARNVRWRSLRERFCSVTGREVTTGEDMTIHFRGSLKIVDFCARHILGSRDYSVNRGADPEPDLVVDYHRLRYLFLRRKHRMILPHRVNQYLALEPGWDATLGKIPRRQQKELRRHLRNYRFTVTFCQGPEAIGHFYKCAFLPYAIFRFGDTASTGNQSPFQMKHRNAIVLWLSVDGVPRGANLLCRRSDTMHIEHCGLTPGSEGMPGLFDCLDYFSLLYAQLGGCAELDFGGTRPHLEDGIFCYKAKWNTAIRAPGLFVPKIRLSIARQSEPVRGFLTRNLFLQTVNNKLIVKVLSGGDSAGPSYSDEIAAKARPNGVDEWLIVPAEAGREPAGTFGTIARQSREPSWRRNSVASYFETI